MILSTHNSAPSAQIVTLAPGSLSPGQCRLMGRTRLTDSAPGRRIQNRSYRPEMAIFGCSVWRMDACRRVISAAAAADLGPPRTAVSAGHEVSAELSDSRGGVRLQPGVGSLTGAD